MLARTRSALALLSLALAAPTQQEVLVRDINAQNVTNPSSRPHDFAMLGGATYFVADHGGFGREIFRATLFPPAVALFVDLVPGPASGLPSDLAVAGQRLFFTSGVPPARQIWVSDGTAAGTAPLATTATRPALLHAVGNVVYFVAFGPNAGEELWRTDGTASGTAMVVDLRPGQGSSSPVPVGVHQGDLLFVADDGWTGRALWRTDGTAQGTRLVAAVGEPFGVTSIGSDVWFSTVQPVVAWRSDGTPAGTVPLRTFSTALFALAAGDFTAIAGSVVFHAPDDAIGSELWISDGTPGGTRLLKEIRPGSAGSGPSGFVTANSGVLLFRADDGVHGRELWRTDGTAAGTFLVTEVNLGPAGGVGSPFVRSGNVFYFPGDDGTHGAELWRTDGTPAGTLLVRDIRPGSLGSAPLLGADDGVPGGIVFAADDGVSGVEPWFSRGTSATTSLLGDIDLPTGGAGSNPVEKVDYYGVTLFRADDGVHGAELWRSDGTAAGTVLVHDIVPGPTGSVPEELTVAGRYAYFLVRVDADLQQLWRTDGTASGTIWLGTLPRVQQLVGGCDSLYLIAHDGRLDWDVWRSDGIGLQRLIPSVPRARLLNCIGDLLFAAVDDGTTGLELWRSDGTPAGTFGIVDLAPGAASGAFHADRVVELGGRVYFCGFDAVHGAELWSTDGTMAGTRLVVDLVPGVAGSTPRALTLARDRLFFVADVPPFGEEPWVTDGTAAGTRLCADVGPGPQSSRITELAARGRDLVFAADLNGVGPEPWMSDGTVAGTRRIDVSAHGFFAAQGFRTAGSRWTWFLAYDQSTWWFVRTDGTASGTQPMIDLGGNAPLLSDIVLSKGSFLFSRFDARIGTELWRFDPGGTSGLVGRGCGQTLRTPAMWLGDPVPGRLLFVEGRQAAPGSHVVLCLAPDVSPHFSLLGCPLYVASTQLVLLQILTASPAGTWSLPLPLPFDPGLAGIPFAMQALLLPPAGGLEATGAVQARFGF